MCGVGKLLRLAAALAAGCLLAPGPAIAQGPPPCDPAARPAAVLTTPKFIAWQRQGEVALKSQEGQIPATWDNLRAQLVAASLGSARPFSGAITVDADSEEYQQANWLLKPDPSSGHARLTATYNELGDGGSPRCQRSVVADVTVGRGKDAEVAADNARVAALATARGSRTR